MNLRMFMNSKTAGIIFRTSYCNSPSVRRVVGQALSDLTGISAHSLVRSCRKLGKLGQAALAQSKNFAEIRAFQ